MTKKETEFLKKWLADNLPTERQLQYQFSAGHLVDYNRVAGAEWLKDRLKEKAGIE